MKKEFKLYIILFCIIIILAVISFVVLPPKIEKNKMNMYLKYINSIIPDPSSKNIKVVTGRENIERLSQAVKAYYMACSNKNTEYVKDIINSKYVEYMNLDVKSVISYNNSSISNVKNLEINTIYEIDKNLYVVAIEIAGERYNTVIQLNENLTKYSIIFDGIYNNDKTIKYELDYQKNE